MNNKTIIKLNKLYLRFLNRNLQQNEVIYFNQLFKTKQLSPQKVVQLIINSEEFARKRDEL